MVRAFLRRGLGAAIFVSLLAASGPALLAASPPAAEHGLGGFWASLVRSVEDLFAALHPATEPLERPPMSVSLEAASEGPEDQATQTDGPGGYPELGHDIDPDG